MGLKDFGEERRFRADLDSIRVFVLPFVERKMLESSRKGVVVHEAMSFLPEMGFDSRAVVEEIVLV